MVTARRATLVAATLAAALGLSACGAQAAAFGGNNAPEPNRPAATTTTTAPPSTPRQPPRSSAPPASSTTTATTVPTAASTTPPDTANSHLPPGEHAAVGTPQNRRPWLTPGTPGYVAAHWVIAYHDLSYTQPVVDHTGLGAWVQRIRPWSTASWWHTLAAPVLATERTGTALPSDITYWKQVVAQQLVDRVEVVEANRIDQAGWTATHEYVQVAWYFRVSNYHSTDVYRGYQHDFTTDYLTMVKVGGRWLVDHEINALNQG